MPHVAGSIDIGAKKLPQHIYIYNKSMYIATLVLSIYDLPAAVVANGRFVCPAMCRELSRMHGRREESRGYECFLEAFVESQAGSVVH